MFAQRPATQRGDTADPETSVALVAAISEGGVMSRSIEGVLLACVAVLVLWLGGPVEATSGSDIHGLSGSKLEPEKPTCNGVDITDTTCPLGNDNSPCSTTGYWDPVVQESYFGDKYYAPQNDFLMCLASINGCDGFYDYQPYPDTDCLEPWPG
jgi:hypothetical protein